MCTAITLSHRDFYFGRTLDLEKTYGEAVVISPRHYRFSFRDRPVMADHYAIIGMAHVRGGYPLYYDGMNEAGLCMAGLNFPGFAQYGKCREGKEKVASFELIPWVLGRYATVAELRRVLPYLELTAESFCPELPATQLHWIVADRRECITLEAVAEGIRVYENPAGVLTNSPSFGEQMFQLQNYMGLSPDPPRNAFSPVLEQRPCGTGLGAVGLPGDLSSQSRFVRAVFAKHNSLFREEECLSQFFHILDTVHQTRGSNRLPDGQCVITQYTSCCNASRGIYHYTTYGNRRICAIEMHRENLEGDSLISFPLARGEEIRIQNGP